MDKVCKKCLILKPLDNFSKNSLTKDKHSSKCKNCVKEYSRQHRLDNKEYYQQYEKNRVNLQHRKDLAKRVTKEYRQNFTKQYKANSALNYAVKSNKIEKLPCIVCGSLEVVAHHPDYDRPLDVIWMCHQHHKQTHSMVLTL